MARRAAPSVSKPGKESRCPLPAVDTEPRRAGRAGKGRLEDRLTRPRACRDRARWLAGALVVLLAVSALPAAARAQVFLGAARRPEFTIGPLFVSAAITPALGPATVSVSWSLVIPPGRRAADVAQDLDLLWPTEVIAATDHADPALAAFVEGRGFKVRARGRLPLYARNRRDMGTTLPFQKVGEAPFVTFFREGAGVTAGRVSTYIRIPWTPRFADPDWLMSLRFEVPGVVVPRPATWAERTFWGERYQASLAFSDVGSSRSTRCTSDGASTSCGSRRTSRCSSSASSRRTT